MAKELNSPLVFRKFAEIYQEKKDIEKEMKKLVSYINRFARDYKQLQKDLEQGKEEQVLLEAEEEKFKTNLDIFQGQQETLEQKKESVDSPKELRSINKEIEYLLEQVRKKEGALLDLQVTKEGLSDKLSEKEALKKELKKQGETFLNHYKNIETLKQQIKLKEKVLLDLLTEFSLPVQHSLKEVIDKNPPDPFTSVQDYVFCRLCGVKLPSSLTRAVKTFSTYHEQNPLLRCQGCGRIIIDVKSDEPEK